ncbi:MAG: serine hydrolase [Lachnospiraceae bacterium]|nr:serine hydrolase [Lachnospiraceae bacterium]
MSKVSRRKSGRNAKIYIGLGILILGIVLIGLIFILKYVFKSEDKISPANLIEIIEAEIIPTGWVGGENNEWYYVNETTYEKESGWLEVDGEKYYLDPITKIRQSGIVEIPGEGWFYFDEEGRLQKDGIVNNHVLNKEGKIERILLNEEELEARNQELKPLIDEIYKKHGAVSGAVALIEGGVVTDTWEYGDAVRNSVPVTEDTKMRVASISKVVVAMNAFRMVDEGIISLDETIGTYWGTPVYNSRYPDDPITFRTILSHTSSIAELSGYTNMEQKIKGNGIFRNTKPGDPASYSYCNFGFCVGGVTLEKAANKTIYDISEEYFFGPMGIDASFAGGRLDNPELLADLYYADRSLARSREKMAGMTGSDVPGYDGSYFPGGLCISAKDLAKMISILVNDGMYEGQRYLSEESVATMESEYGPADYHGVQVTQCLPLKYQTNMYGEEGLYFHSGSAYGAFNLASYNPETRSGVVVLSIGASGACDEYGAYAVCGDISELLYQETNKLMFENVIITQEANESETTVSGND